MPNSLGLSPGPAPLRLTAKLTAKLDDTRGPQGMTLDGYTRPELRRCGRRGPPEQLPSPRVKASRCLSGSDRRHQRGLGRPG
jgi:hypothetical protein